MEMGEIPLGLRYKQLMLIYYVIGQVQNEGDHPSVKALSPCWGESGKVKGECYVWAVSKMAK